MGRFHGIARTNSIIDGCLQGCTSTVHCINRQETFSCSTGRRGGAVGCAGEVLGRATAKASRVCRNCRNPGGAMSGGGCVTDGEMLL